MRFLFLPILRCFSSRRSPLREAIAVGIPIRRSPVLRLRAAPWSVSQLGTSFVGFRAEPFTRWHSSHVVVVSPGGDSRMLCEFVTNSRRLLNSVKRVQWTPGSHVHTVSFTRPRQRCVYRPFPSAFARDGASVFRDGSSALSHLRDSESSRQGHGPTGI